jgi:hypothetical protein
MHFLTFSSAFPIAVATFVLGFVGTSPLQAQGNPKVEALTERAYDLEGCYALRWGVWTEPEWSVVSDQLPRRIWLTATGLGTNYYGADSSNVAVHFVMRPAPGEREVEYPNVRWATRSENDSIVLSWSSPFQGVTAVLGVTGSVEARTLQGYADAWTDELRIVSPGSPPIEAPSAPVVAESVDCS